MILTYFPGVDQQMVADRSNEAYRIAGGAPAGIIKLPGDEGCRTTSTIISMITIQGNRSTAPNGTEILELPFNRIRLLKKDNLGVIRAFSLLRSDKEGREGVEGMRLAILWINPMAGGIED